MNLGELIKEIVDQVRLEQMYNDNLLFLTHLQIHHGENYSDTRKQVMQLILECNQKRFELEKELIQKYEGKQE